MRLKMYENHFLNVYENEERQIKKMLELGIEERMIFVDKQSGKDFERPGYQTMKRILRKGDLLYLDALDRLGRDYDGIIQEWKQKTHGGPVFESPLLCCRTRTEENQTAPS
jgi:hypothetical protein